MSERDAINYVVAFKKYWQENTAKNKRIKRLNTNSVSEQKNNVATEENLEVVPYVVEEVEEKNPTPSVKEESLKTKEDGEKVHQSVERDKLTGKETKKERKVWEKNEGIFNNFPSVLWDPVEYYFLDDESDNSSYEADFLTMKFKGETIMYSSDLLTAGDENRNEISDKDSWGFNSYNIRNFDNATAEEKAMIQNMIRISFPETVINVFGGIEKAYRRLDATSTPHQEYLDNANDILDEEDKDDTPTIKTANNIFDQNDIEEMKLKDNIAKTNIFTQYYWRNIGNSIPTLPIKDNDFQFIIMLFKKYCSKDFYKNFSSQESLRKYFQQNSPTDGIEKIKNLVSHNWDQQNLTQRLETVYSRVIYPYKWLDLLAKEVLTTLNNSIIYTKNKEFFLLTGHIQFAHCLKIESKNTKNFINFHVEFGHIEYEDEEDEDGNVIGEYQEWWPSNHSISGSVYTFDNDTNSVRSRDIVYDDDEVVNDTKLIDKNYPIIYVNNSEDFDLPWEIIAEDNNRGIIAKHAIYNGMVLKNNMLRNEEIALFKESHLESLSIGIKAINLNKLIPNFTLFPKMTEAEMKYFETENWEEYQICKDFLILNDIESVFKFSEKELTPEVSKLESNLSNKQKIIRFV